MKHKDITLASPNISPVVCCSKSHCTCGAGTWVQAQNRSWDKTAQTELLMGANPNPDKAFISFILKNLQLLASFAQHLFVEHSLHFLHSIHCRETGKSETRKKKKKKKAGYQTRGITTRPNQKSHLQGKLGAGKRKRFFHPATFKRPGESLPPRKGHRKHLAPASLGIFSPGNYSSPA